jgi:hypothetical protein
MNNETINRQAGIKERKRYLADLRAFFLACGLCGAGGVFKNRLAISSIVISFVASFRFCFFVCMVYEVASKLLITCLPGTDIDRKIILRSSA